MPTNVDEMRLRQGSRDADLGDTYQRLLAADTRRAAGIYYTPADVANSIAAATLRPLIEQAHTSADPITALLALRVADLSCGSGRMLAAAARVIAAALAQLGHDDARAALQCVYGCDSDPLAVEVARHCLAAEFDAAAPNLVAADGLGELPAAWREFDAVLGNPPYVSNKALDPDVRARLRLEYRTARGQFDLCVPFVEAGLRVLRPGGMLGYILSNKFMAADYGASLRELLLEANTLVELRDVSSADIFAGAAIYPAIMIVRHAPPQPDHQVQLGATASGKRTVAQQSFSSHPGRIIATADDFGATVAAMQRAAQPLGRRLVRCGIADSGFAGRARELATNGAASEYMPLLAAGHVGEYVIEKGASAGLVGRAESGARRWDDFARPKLLLPGISLRLRAAYDPGGHALGRIYYIDAATVDAYLLLALLNSDLLDHYYRYFYWPAHLSGGYLRINSTYLATLPLSFTPSAATTALSNTCRDLLLSANSDPAAIRQMLEPQVRQLYGLPETD